MFCKWFIGSIPYIFDSDFQVETTLHEMMHAAGSLHEQSRLQDREFFISTIWPRTSSAINFFGYQLTNAREYDLGSVLQYNLYVSVAKSRDMLVTFTIWWDALYIHVHPFLIKEGKGFWYLSCWVWIIGAADMTKHNRLSSRSLYKRLPFD